MGSGHNQGFISGFPGMLRNIAGLPPVQSPPQPITTFPSQTTASAQATPKKAGGAAAPGPGFAPAAQGDAAQGALTKTAQESSKSLLGS